MSDELRIKLGKSRIEQGRNSSPSSSPTADHKWPHWAKALAAFKAGYVEPEKRFPIVISAENPMSSPEKIRELADLPSEPEISKTTKTSLYTNDTDNNPNPEEVLICDVNYQQLVRIEELTEWSDTCVWFQGVKRTAVMILSLKAGTKPVSDKKDGGIQDSGVQGKEG